MVRVAPLSLLVLCVWALLLLSAPVSCIGKNYAVLISSIKGWENLAYSVQADVCHAYNLLIQSGMAHDDIILFSFGDAAWDAYNAFPGSLYNRAWPNNSKPIDVNVGCGQYIDYVGYDVSPDNFLNVLIGNHSGVPKGLPVLESNEEDNVFISFEDHGSPGAVYFVRRFRQRPFVTHELHPPVADSSCPPLLFLSRAQPDFAPLYAVDIIKALETMYKKGMYQRLVFYLMACESGSMFASGMLPSNISIYATAAASPSVSAYPVFCSPLDTVGGVRSGVKGVSNCLASDFGVAWTNETETQGLTQSLNQQFLNVNASMTTSTPGQYGDLTWKGLPIGDIFTDYHSGQKGRVWADNAIHLLRPEDEGKVSMAPGSFKLFMLQNRIDDATPGSAEEAQARADMAAEMTLRAEVDALFSHFATASMSVAGRNGVQVEQLMASPALPIVHTACMRQVDEAIARQCGGYTDYSRRYAGLVINTCRAVAELGAEAETQLPQLMADLCTQRGSTVRAQPSTLQQE